MSFPASVTHKTGGCRSQSPETGPLYGLHFICSVLGSDIKRFYFPLLSFRLAGLFPTMYLSTGTCIVFIITGGSVMELLFQVICDDDLGCKAKTLTGPQWVHDPVKTGGDDDGSGFRHVLNGLGIIVLAFKGHNLMLEIQGTIPTNPKKPSRKSMWRGVIISYLLIAMCMYPIAIVGHWAYENKVYPNLGILTSFINFHRKSTPKLLTGAICLAAIIHYLCAYQIYAMPALDNFERFYVTKKNKPWPEMGPVGHQGLVWRHSRSCRGLGLFVGSLAMPLTLVYPCMMWVAVKKPVRFSMMWCINVGLGV
ncbi:lysine histidine transporter-like 7, partial [Phtheirospermum japonicum]